MLCGVLREFGLPEGGDDGNSCTKATTSSSPSAPATGRPMTAERTVAGCEFSTASTSAG